MIDNNLHLTNWKRKQGCKCQHKNQVDWCGCSPNVFKSLDFDRLLMYKGKIAYFARKFEPVINQDIINSVDSMMTRDNADLPAMSHYWHNIYHHLDPRSSSTTPLYISYFNSLIRRNLKALGSVASACTISDIHIEDSHVLYVADHFHRLLIKYNVTMTGLTQPVTLESQFSFKQHYNVLDPFGPIGSLQTLEVGTDFDVKELVFRNYAGFLGPDSDIGLRHVWGYGLEASLSVAWIDPAGIVAAYLDLTVAKDARIDFQKPKLKHPLRPGVWTVKLLYKLKVCVEIQFVVLPYTNTLDGKELGLNEVITTHNGPDGLYSSMNFSDFTGKLGLDIQKELYRNSVINGRKVGKDLEEWVDELSSFSWSIQDTCSSRNLPYSCLPLNICSNTRWSSLSPDLKCDLSSHFHM
ncbi:Xylosyltransferase 1 [Mactra antiquata]